FGGWLFTSSPLRLPTTLSIAARMVHLIGMGLLAWATLDFALAAVLKEPLLFKGLRLKWPPVQAALPQLCVSSVDWILAAFVLYLLMPDSVDTGFIYFLAVFVSAQILGLIAHVPGGIGVLDALVVFLISPDPTSRSAVLGGL